MKICVVGGSGFIGTNLCIRLLGLRHEVSVIDLKESAILKKCDIESRIKWFTGNYHDPDLLSRALNHCDVLFHLASSTIPSTSNENPAFDIESNLVTSIRLIESAKQEGVSKIIFISSGGTVYGIPEYTPVSESHPHNPICSYGICKLATEKYLKMYKHIGGADYEIFRLSNPYGPYQNPFSPQGVIPVFIRKILLNEKITIWGDGEVIRDFIFIDDVIDIFVRSLENGNVNKVYNLGSGIGKSINSVLQSISELSGKNPNVYYAPSRSIDVPENVLDISAITNEYEWKPKVTFEDGLARTMEYVKRFLNI